MLPCTEEEVEALFYFILFLIYTSLSNLLGPSRSPSLTSRRYTVWEWHKRSLRVNTRLQRESAINTIQYILLIIFRKSLSCGKIPSEWKHANICPVYQMGDKHDPINYRPISLTCICCKLLEHIISSNIRSHLENNNDLQHGFRPSRSCETQLISFLQHVSQSNNQNIQTDVVIMDFAKAFDKVPHQHLFYKLKYYGISCNAYDWISDFVTDRTQTVVPLRAKCQVRLQLQQESPRALFWDQFFF